MEGKYLGKEEYPKLSYFRWIAKFWDTALPISQIDIFFCSKGSILSAYFHTEPSQWFASCLSLLSIKFWLRQSSIWSVIVQYIKRAWQVKQSQSAWVGISIVWQLANVSAYSQTFSFGAYEHVLESGRNNAGFMPSIASTMSVMVRLRSKPTFCAAWIVSTWLQVRPRKRCTIKIHAQSLKCTSMPACQWVVNMLAHNVDPSQIYFTVSIVIFSLLNII